jgi:hypothetical protein
MFASFGLVQLFQGVLPDTYCPSFLSFFKGRNRAIERTYITLSFLAKGILGVIVLSAVVFRN